MRAQRSPLLAILAISSTLCVAAAFTAPLSSGSLFRSAGRVPTGLAVSPRRPSSSSRIVPLLSSKASAEPIAIASSSVSDSLYACPQCNTPCSLEDASCSNCGAPFAVKDGYTDLTPDSTKVKKEEENVATRFGSNPIVNALIASAGLQLPGRPLRQELFRTPYVSYLYERGWRNSFAQAGFPGIDKEYKLVLDFFQEAKGGTVIDLSCGSGLMVRRLAKTPATPGDAAAKDGGFFGKVIAVDFSESMLGEVIKRAKEEDCPDFDVVRADVANMPFCDASVDAIHSGAALHCWPSVQDGLAQVARVIKPGGKFFATTFLWGIPDEAVSLGENLSSVSGRRAYRFFSPTELEYLMKSAGFSSVEVEQLDRCAIIRCVR